MDFDPTMGPVERKQRPIVPRIRGEILGVDRIDDNLHILAMSQRTPLQRGVDDECEAAESN
jgi:hypothetical protein